MKRLLFNFLTLASALLFLLTLTVTIRSFWTQDCFFHNANNPPRGFTSQYDLWIKKLHDRDPTPLPPNVFVRWRLISAKAGLHFQWIHWDNDHGLDGEFDPMTIDFGIPTAGS